MLAAYVSGHGWGHATRMAEVLRAVRKRARTLPIAVSSEAPAFLFEEAIAPPLSVRSLRCDVGLVQRDAVSIDEPASLAAWREFTATWDDRVETEARWLAAAGARLVLADIPPLAFAASKRANVPALGLTNFSWDWVYSHLGGRVPGFAEAADWARSAYRSAELLLRLPFAGELRAFPRVEDLPLVARLPRQAKREARRRLGLDERPALLLSFGGSALPGLDLVALGTPETQLLLSAKPRDGAVPPSARVLDRAALDAAELRFPDLVAAADVVVTKPGYGIVSECIAARTRIVYTERGDFPEYPIMVAEMGGYLPAVHVSNAELAAGRIGRALEEVLAAAFPPRPRLDGALVAAERILASLSASHGSSSSLPGMA